jgi:hypothetical protein
MTPALSRRFSKTNSAPLLLKKKIFSAFLFLFGLLLLYLFTRYSYLRLPEDLQNFSQSYPKGSPLFIDFYLENPLLAYFSFFLPPPPPLSRYQIIVLQPPQSSKRTLTLSRLIGFPKDRLEIQENKQNHSQEKVLVLVLENGKETLVLGNPIAFSSLPLGTLSNYLVLNDNSLSPEQDSRHFGLISFQQIRGQVLMIGSFLRPLPSPKERTKNF